MTDEYIYITGQDGEIYEVRPTEALLCFLQRLAEGEANEQALSVRLPHGEGELSCVGKS